PQAAEFSILKAISFRPEQRQNDAHGFSEELFQALTGTGDVERLRKLRPTGWKAKLIAAVAVFSVFAFAGVAGYHSLWRPRILTESDSIVLADFTNTTGDPVFDGALRQAVSLKLAESPLLNILPDDQMSRTLPLMGHKADERITPQLARKICERKGLKA